MFKNISKYIKRHQQWLSSGKEDYAGIEVKGGFYFTLPVQMAFIM